MYAIVYWEFVNTETVRPVLNSDGTLFLNEDLTTADVDAFNFEKLHPGIQTRVISIEGVKE